MGAIDRFIWLPDINSGPEACPVNTPHTEDYAHQVRKNSTNRRSHSDLTTPQYPHKACMLFPGLIVFLQWDFMTCKPHCIISFFAIWKYQ